MSDNFKFLDDQGREIPDPQPIAIPAGYKLPESLSDQIRRLIRSEQFSKMVNDQGFDTFEEAEDFEIDDDMWDPSSPYEEVFDPVLGRGITLDEFRQNEALYQQRFMEADKRAHDELVRSEALRAKVRKEATAENRRAPSERDSEGNPPVPPTPKA